VTQYWKLILTNCTFLKMYFTVSIVKYEWRVANVGCCSCASIKKFNVALFEYVEQLNILCMKWITLCNIFQTAQHATPSTSNTLILTSNNASAGQWGTTTIWWTFFTEYFFIKAHKTNFSGFPFQKWSDGGGDRVAAKTRTCRPFAKYLLLQKISWLQTYHFKLKLP
jgi:hypothetical protein